ncbi:MAG TPA: hypothetical protein VJI67_00205, partial [archaeon]|nr:hypothetical protein [archaeon]
MAGKEFSGDVELESTRLKLEKLLNEHAMEETSGGSGLTEVKELLLLVVKENRELSRKVNSLVAALEDASRESISDTTEQSLHTISESEINILNRLERLSGEIKETKDSTRLSEEVQKTMLDLKKDYVELSNKVTALRSDQQSIENSLKNVITSKLKELDSLNAGLQQVNNNVAALGDLPTKYESLSESVHKASMKIQEFSGLINEAQFSLRTLLSKASALEQAAKESIAKESTIEQVTRALSSRLEKPADSKVQEEIEVLNAGLDGLHKALEKLDKKAGAAGETAVDVHLMKTEVRALEERIEELMKAVEKGAGKKMEDEFGKVVYKLDLLQENLKDFEAKVKRDVALDVKGIHTDLDALRGEVVMLKNRKETNVKPVFDELNSLSEKVNSLAATVSPEEFSSLSKKIDSVKAELSGFENFTLGVLKKDLEEVDRKATALGREVSALKLKREPLKVEAVKNEVETLRQQLESVAERAQSNPDVRKSISEAIETIGTKVGALEGHVYLNERQQNTEHGARLTEVSSRLGELLSKTGPRQGKDSNLRERVEQLRDEWEDAKRGVGQRQAFEKEIQKTEAKFDLAFDAIQGARKQQEKAPKPQKVA